MVKLSAEALPAVVHVFINLTITTIIFS